MDIEFKDYIALTGIIVTLIISAISLYIGLKNTRKTLFINAITTSRIKHIDKLRTTISEFCGLTYHFALTELTDEARNNLILKIDNLRFLIKLQLNKTDDYDQKIISIIDLIPNLTRSNMISELEKEINELVLLTQDLLNLEWQGAKSEAKHGDLKIKTKQKLLKNHLG